MSRLSREKKRDQQPGATPIDVRVPLTGESATVAGTPVAATHGEELHQTVLTHLHHLARTAGHTVHATIHDARIGYVVPLEVTTDGSSRFTAEPVRMAPPAGTGSEPTAGEPKAPGTAPEAGAAGMTGLPTGPVILGSAGREPGDPVAPVDEPGPRRPTGDQGAGSMPFGETEESERTPWPSGTPAAFAPHDRSPEDSAVFASQDRAPEGPAVPPSGDRSPEAPAAFAPHDRSPEHPDAPAPHDPSAHSSRPLPEPTGDPSPTFRLRNLPAPQLTDAEPSPTHVLRQLPDTPPTGLAPAPDPAPAPAPAPAPGTVAPPTGEFGPPPVMDGSPALPPAPESLSPTDSAPTPWPPLPPTPGPLPSYGPGPAPVRPLPPTDLAPPPPPPPAPTPMPLPPPPVGFTPTPTPQPLPSTPPTPRPTPLLDPVPLLDDPDPRPTPVRGFDAVAEALMGEETVLDGASVLAEPVGRIGEAVRDGRIDAAEELAEQVVAEAAGSLGPDHPDVLRVRELAAYIAYLGGEPVRATEISLDLAAVQHRAGDAESAYGNVQSAATAWKAVRDPLKGLALGSDLLTLWTEMAAGEGPAADEPDRLESARARMLRLAERARNADR
ncbi:hypothetical protein ACI2L1_12750 [Streptomyces sp. NPDC019531]|uniref:hypothetical protein n=1 Tax=Streptomyces sp. NPDC019531 TaxID=3365062 RepID=UPI00384BB0DD